MSVRVLIGEIIRWLGEQADNIEECCQYPGGFEGWLQCEMIRFLNARDGVAVFYEREAGHVYGNVLKRADFLFHLKNRSYIVELKCQSRQTVGFEHLIMEDIDKLNQAMGEYQNYEGIVLGVFTQGYSNEMDDFVERPPCMTVTGVNRINGNIYLFYMITRSVYIQSLADNADFLN